MTSQSIIPFQFEGKPVRIIYQDGAEWFVARDVVLSLGAVWKGHDSIKHVPEQWRGVRSVWIEGRYQEVRVLLDKGVYFYLNRSDKKAALPIQEWIAGEVLPSIRKTGSYSIQPAPQPVALPTPRELAVMLIAAIDRAEAAEADKQVAESALDLITASEKSITMTCAAKALGMKPHAFTAWMRENKWIYLSSQGQVASQLRINDGCLEQKFYDRNTGGYADTQSPGTRPQVFVKVKGMAKLSKIFSVVEEKAE